MIYHPLLAGAERNVDPAHHALARDAEALINASMKDSSKRQYVYWSRIIDEWCAENGHNSLPMSAETLQLFLAAKQSLSPWTLHCYLTAISQRHLCARLPDPAKERQVRNTIRGIRRRASEKPSPRVDIEPEQLIRLIDSLGSCRKDQRDRSWILLAYAGGLWAQEICDLRIEQLIFVGDDGLCIAHGGDREATKIPRGRNSWHCPVYQLRLWLNETRICNGIVYPSMNSLDQGEPKKLNQVTLNRILHKRCAAAGMPTIYTTTSLRVARLLHCAEAGMDRYELWRQSGLAIETVDRYIEIGVRRRKTPQYPSPMLPAPMNNAQIKAALAGLADQLELRRADLCKIFSIRLRDLQLWQRKTIPTDRHFALVRLHELGRELARRYSGKATDAFRTPIAALHNRSLLQALKEDGVERITSLILANPYLLDGLT